MTDWLISKAATASDANGGTSKTIRSSGSDAIVNTTAGTTKVTSITAAWTAADVGHGICVAGKFRLVSAITAGGVLGTIGKTNASAAITSAGLFTAAMVGQAITGTGIPANTVIQAVADANNATMSQTATNGTSVTATLYVMATTTGNVAFTAGTAQAWVVGGMWSTIFGSALATNSPITNADNVYIGPGVYRESGTANLTAPTATVNIIGDVYGTNTGTTAGEVRWTAQLVNDLVAGSTLCTITGKHFLAFSKITFHAGGNVAVFSGNAHDVSFTSCAFIGGNAAIWSPVLTVGIAANITFDSCYILGTGSSTLFAYTAPTSTVADYDVNITFKNCKVLCAITFVSIIGSGANSFKGNGIDIRGCTVWASTILTTSGTGIATSISSNVTGCLCFNTSTGLSANTTGQIVEDYNVFASSPTARSNVAIGVHSGGLIGTLPAVFFGQEAIWGGLPRPFLSLYPDHPFIGWGDDGNTPATDMLDKTRPAGVGRLVTTGTATAGTATTLTNSGAAFGAAPILNGAIIRITGGTGSGQYKMIRSHTNTVITVFGNWTTTPDSTSTYAIYFGPPVETFTCTSGSTTTAVLSSGAWSTNQWLGFTLEVVSGTGSGQTTTVSSNNGTTLTVAALATGLDNTSVVKLYRKTSETAVPKTPGAVERHTSWQTETVTTNDNTTPISTIGAGDHEFLVPVHSGHATTISAYLRYDSTYAGTLPQLIIAANAVIGVTAETKTQAGSANTWEKLTLSSFTPTADGLVRVTVRANSTHILGKTFADTFAVSQT